MLVTLRVLRVNCKTYQRSSWFCKVVRKFYRQYHEIDSVASSFLLLISFKLLVALLLNASIKVRTKVIYVCIYINECGGRVYLGIKCSMLW